MQLLPAAASLLFAEVDIGGERVDQARGEEVRGREVESHLPQVPLPEPHCGHDQGPLAHHEETGNALNLRAFLFVFFWTSVCFLEAGPECCLWEVWGIPTDPNHD